VVGVTVVGVPVVGAGVGLGEGISVVGAGVGAGEGAVVGTGVGAGEGAVVEACGAAVTGTQRPQVTGHDAISSALASASYPRSLAVLQSRLAVLQSAQRYPKLSM